MTAVRADVAELLHAGYGDRFIARQLNMPRRDVTAARTELGLPGASMGPKPAASVEDLFWRRVKAAPGDHLAWGGARNARGTAIVRHGGRLYTALQVAFGIAAGRDPEGYVIPSCEFEGCVKPGHQKDRAMREEAQTIDHLFGAIFGEAS